MITITLLFPSLVPHLPLRFSVKSTWGNTHVILVNPNLRTYTNITIRSLDSSPI